MRNYKNKTVLIMGLGLHGGGVGAANYFTSLGARVIVTDLKTKSELEESIGRLSRRAQIRFTFGKHEFEDFRSADLVIKNPGVPADSPYIRYALKNGVPVKTDIGIFLEEIESVTNNIFGVTGTKGKSTTASLLHSIMRARHSDALIGGNLTGSVLELLPQVRKGCLLILELSSFQLGGIASKGFSPRLGVFTNFIEDHLNYYPSMKEYFDDKSVLFRFQSEGDVLVVNRDDAVWKLVTPSEGVNLVSFGMKGDFHGEGSYLSHGTVYYRSGGEENPILKVSSIQLPGAHNLYNVLAAVAAASIEGMDARDIEKAVRRFQGIAHRLEFVGSRGGINFINDTSATIPRASIEGIRSFSGGITLIAGGSDKNLELSAFIRTIEERVSRLVLLQGSGTERLLKCGLRKEHRIHRDLRSAVLDAYQNTPPGDTILLSPGFASFGMFRNEFHRGNEFKEIVLSLPEKEV